MRFIYPHNFHNVEREFRIRIPFQEEYLYKELYKSVPNKRENFFYIFSTLAEKSTTKYFLPEFECEILLARRNSIRDTSIKAI